MSLRFRYGNVLDIVDAELICHQVNCLTVKSHGLSNQVALKYPWADIYHTRTPINGRNLASKDTRGIPGKVKVFHKTGHPAVACLQAQWDFGRINNSKKRNIQPYNDTKENREQWFQSYPTSGKILGM